MDNTEEKKTPPVETKRLEGKWYEQRAKGAVITIDGSHLEYDDGDEKKNCSFRLGEAESGGHCFPLLTSTQLLKWEMLEFYNWGDTDHDRLQTKMTMVVYDMQYSPRVFKRTPYEAPKYGDIHHNTDARAIKWFQDYRVRRLHLEVAEPRQEAGMMAPTPPDFGFYVYDILRNEDGGGVIRAKIKNDHGAFWGGKVFEVPEVELSPAQMNELALKIANGNLDKLNGVDVWQDGVPSGTPSYDLSIEFYKESYHSRANHIFIPETWKKDGRGLHMYIFRLLVEAGLDYGRNEFHSTKPMLRIGIGKKEEAGYLVKLETEEHEKKGEAYDYKASYEIASWKYIDNVPEALKTALDNMAAQMNKEEEARGGFLYRAMSEIPEEKRLERTPPYYASRYLGTFRETYDPRFFAFWLSRGEIYNPEPEGGLQNKDPHGDHLTYCFDTADGHQMCAADFYTDVEALIDKLIALVGKNYSGEMLEKLNSAEYREVLRTRLNTPEAEDGIGFEPVNTGMLFRVLIDLDQSRAPWVSEYTVPYDDSQDILNKKYCTVR